MKNSLKFSFEDGLGSDELSSPIGDLLEKSENKF